MDSIAKSVRPLDIFASADHGRESTRPSQQLKERSRKRSRSWQGHYSSLSTVQLRLILERGDGLRDEEAALLTNARTIHAHKNAQILTSA